MSQHFEPSVPPRRAQVEAVAAPGRVDILPLPTALFLVLAFVMMVLVWTWPEEGGLWGPGMSAILGWLLFVFHIACTRRYLNSFDPAIWIPVLFLLFYLGAPVAVELLGSGTLREYDSWRIGIVPPRLNQTFASGVFCVTAFLAGMHLAGFRDLSRGRYTMVEPRRGLFGPSMALMLGGMFLTLAGIAVLGPGLLFGGYGDMKYAFTLGKADFRLFGTGQLFLQAGCFGVIGCHTEERKSYTTTAVAFLVIMAALLLATGDRGGLSAMIFGAGWVYHLRVRRLPWIPVVGGFIFALILVPVIGEWRQDMSMQAGQRRSTLELLQAGFMTMGSCFTVFSYTFEYIPRIKPYDMGLSFVAQTAANIPNFGFDTSRTFTMSLNPWEHLPSQWLIYVSNPAKFFDGESGYGYAFGAELYFNFGFPGMLIGLIFTGWLLGVFRNNALRGPFWMVNSALYIQMFVILIRNSIGYPVRTALWPFIGFLVLWLLWPQQTTRRPYVAGAEDLSTLHAGSEERG